MIPLFVTKLLRGERIPIYGDGKNVRDWLHVSDHCQAIYTVLLKGAPGESYNVGGGTELTNMELTKQILEILGKDVDRIDFVSDRLGHDYRYSVDWSKIKKLGYEPQINYAQGIRKTIEWYIDHQ
jgi:dTDP-glucose 4,6-dehydratase